MWEPAFNLPGQFFLAKGFEQKVVHAGLQTFFFFAITAAGGDRNDGDFAFLVCSLANPSRGFEAVHLRQVTVHQNQRVVVAVHHG